MEGVIAREREINWSEVHFQSAFKTPTCYSIWPQCRFSMHVFIPEYLGVNKSMSSWWCVCVCVCLSVCPPCPVAQPLISTGLPLFCRFTDYVFTKSSFFLPVIKTVFMQYLPSHFRQSRGHLTVYRNVYLWYVWACRKEKNIRKRRLCMCEQSCMLDFFHSWCVYFSLFCLHVVETG